MDDGSPIALEVTIDPKAGTAVFDFEGALCLSTSSSSRLRTSGLTTTFPSLGRQAPARRFAAAGTRPRRSFTPPSSTACARCARSTCRSTAAAVRLHPCRPPVIRRPSSDRPGARPLQSSPSTSRSPKARCSRRATRPPFAAVTVRRWPTELDRTELCADARLMLLSLLASRTVVTSQRITDVVLKVRRPAPHSPALRSHVRVLTMSLAHLRPSTRAPRAKAAATT